MGGLTTGALSKGEGLLLPAKTTFFINHEGHEGHKA